MEATHSRIRPVSDQGPGVATVAEGISESLTLGRPPSQTNKQTNVEARFKADHRYFFKETNDRFSNFYSQVSQDLIAKLYAYYKRDYDMFGYPPPLRYLLIDENENPNGISTLTNFLRKISLKDSNKE